MIRRLMDFLREAIELASPVRGPSLGADAGECNNESGGSSAFAWTFLEPRSDSSFSAATPQLSSFTPHFFRVTLWAFGIREINSSAASLSTHVRIVVLVSSLIISRPEASKNQPQYTLQFWLEVPGTSIGQFLLHESMDSSRSSSTATTSKSMFFVSGKMLMAPVAASAVG
jgi:hypothetical protein